MLKYKYYNTHTQNYKLYDVVSEAHGLKVYEIGVLGKIVGPKRQEEIT
jgi:hypothetical protein